MFDKLPPHFLDLVADALLHSFWRKRSLRSFLRRLNIKDAFLATWPEDTETKRDFIYRLFPHLEKTEAGQGVLRNIARELADQVKFPDLDRWEDSNEKKARAADAVRVLKTYLANQREEVETSKEQAAARKRAQAVREERARQTANLDSLRARLDRLATRLGSAEAGYEFQDWFYDLVGHFELVARRPYVSAGRQIDGSVTVDGTTYLVELKFTTSQADAPDIDVFFKKVTDKADNTMGIMVSISSYSSVAIDGASIPKTPLLLLDHGHLYALLGGTVTFSELVGRVRRHSSRPAVLTCPRARCELASRGRCTACADERSEGIAAAARPL
jgi:hypothetical protein